MLRTPGRVPLCDLLRRANPKHRSRSPHFPGYDGLSRRQGNKRASRGRPSCKGLIRAVLFFVPGMSAEAPILSFQGQKTDLQDASLFASGVSRGGNRSSPIGECFIENFVHHTDIP